MGILGSFKLLWYTTVSLGFLYLGISPLLGALGLEPITGIVEGDIKLLLIIMASLLLTALIVVLTSGYLVLGGWRGDNGVPRNLRLVLAVPAGIAIFVLGGALSLLVPVPILPIILAALLIWAILRFVSGQVFPPKPQTLDVDRAEELAVKFWRSRNPADTRPTPLNAILDGDTWTITLTGKERTGQLDIDARSGIVMGWRLGQ